MKKVISLLLAVLLVFSLAACGAKDADVPTEKTNIRLATLKGPTGIGTAKLMQENDAGNAANNYTVTLCADPTEVMSGMAAGNFDLAACPLNMASVMYNKLSGNLQILAINTLGTLYMLSTNDVADIGALRGKTVVLAGQGATPPAPETGSSAALPTRSAIPSFPVTAYSGPCAMRLRYMQRPERPSTPPAALTTARLSALPTGRKRRNRTLPSRFSEKSAPTVVGWHR